MLNLAVIVGSTRLERQGGRIAQWLYTQLDVRKSDFVTTIVDLQDYRLPFLEEASRPTDDEAATLKRFLSVIEASDAYIMVVPEYNHSFPGVLKNAIDHAYTEWRRKPVAFVSYSSGVSGGVRAVEQLRLVMIEFEMAVIRGELNIPRAREAFDAEGNLINPSAHKKLDALFAQLLWWGNVLKAARVDSK